ncbi:MAG: YbaN family protein [Kofleriaceae bacterium]
MIGRAARIGYLVLGTVCVGLGIIGAFLPVMPTTVFLLVAVWAYSKSSARLERWLIEHPRFGKRIRDWREHHTIPLPVKLTAWSSMAASFAVMLVLHASVIALVSAGTFMAIGAVYIATRPSRPPPSRPDGGA